MMSGRFRFGLRGRVVRRRYAASLHLVPKSELRAEAATAVAAFKRTIVRQKRGVKLGTGGIGLPAGAATGGLY